MTRTIKVTGKSNVKASPDYTRISLTISDTLMEYDACLAKSVEDMNIIVGCIKEFGFERKELKTSNFEINRKTEGYRDKHNDWKHRQNWCASWLAISCRSSFRKGSLTIQWKNTEEKAIGERHLRQSIRA